jgi:DNA-binding transcriptional ArsR family regulator
MSEQILDSLSHLFLALSDKTRLRLLSLMTDGEVSVGYLAASLGESQPKISRHLAYLRSAGIVSSRRDGKWIYYAVASQPDLVADELLAAALRSISGRPVLGAREEGPMPEAADTAANNIYGQTDMTEWQPAELDVFLL